MTRTLAAALCLTLAACGGTPLRFDAAPVAQGQVPVSVGTVEVREVSLPLYADQEVIFFQDETGALVSDDELLWADDPTRSFTEGLAMTLAGITRAQVAAEPWPFADRPAARVDVRFSRALPQNDGRYRVTGQYFVAAPEGLTREVARSFDLSVPYDGTTVGSIAAARARVIADLARLIAQDGL